MPASAQISDEPKARSLLRTVVGNASILLGGKSVNAVLSLAYTALAARALGIEQFGLLVLIHAFAQTIADIAKFQSWQVIIHYGTAPMAEGRRSDFQRLLRFSLVLDGGSAVVGTALGVAGATLLGTWLGWTVESVPAAMLYATSIVFMVSATPTGVLRLLDRFDLMALQNSLGALIRLIGAAVAFAMGGGLEMFLTVWYLATVLAFATLFGSAWWLLRRRDALAAFPWRQGGLTEGFPGLWRFAWTTNLNTTLNLAFKQLTVLMIGGMLGPREAALFRIARQVADAVAKPSRLLIPALYPELARLYAAGKLAELRRLAVQVGLMAGGVASVLLAVVAVAGGPALRIVIGVDFMAAAEVMTWLVAAAVVGIWALPLEPLLISVGEATRTLVIRIGTIILYIPVQFMLVDHFGLVGAGIGTLGGAVLLFAGQMAACIGWYRRPRATLAEGA